MECKSSGAWRRGMIARVQGPSLRANGSRECAPDDRLREAIHLYAYADAWIASLLALLARDDTVMGEGSYTATRGR